MLSLLGAFLGCMIHVVLASIGLSAIIMKFSVAYEVIKYLGVLYLLYLGLTFLFKGKKPKSEKVSVLSEGKKIILQGIFTDVLNPKVALFFLAFLPQFVNPYSANVWFRFLSLGVFFNITGTLLLLTVVYLVAKSSTLLRKTLFWKCQEKITGFMLIALGINLLLDKRN